ncbi:MAG: hypothetical protein IJQ12_02940 [Lachnospiraceae bacterium]|nr:hypothetical protein [Lachnospiraceae bacterium]
MCKKLLLVFFITVIGGIVLCAGVTAAVDPFFVFHAPLSRFPYEIDNQLTQNPGMARHFSYDSAIIGSSMTFNFDTRDFEERMGLHTIKLSYSGAYTRDDAIILEQIFTREGIKEIFIPIDIVSFGAEPEETKFPVPYSYYDRNPFNDIPYLLNKDVLLQYIIKPLMQPEPTPLHAVYAETWRQEEEYDAVRVLSQFTPSPVRKEETARESLNAQAKVNLDANLIPFIEAHPETTFTFFFPPYSILFWYDLAREKRLDATLDACVYVAGELLRYDNVRVFYFQDMEEYITDLDNYADYSHYHPDMNRYMTACFADGIREIKSAEELRERTGHLALVTERFNYEALMEMSERQ